ncbi:unnamed protein product [Blepharisma stoltei]|uniref:Mitochondrial carrier protein n=1 Tax=Blepharisma stoltei TaxID=1481888 RepID=A0AAU9JZK8_9CILI|nr:unnamed protein product [Blepharisma stoltei]
MTDLLSTLYVSLVAGGTAGAAVETIIFPFDSIKIRLQANSNLKFKFSNAYKGLPYSLAATFPCAAAFWTSYSMLKNYLNQYVSLQLSHTISAMVASACSGIVRNPFDVVKQQMQVGIHTKTSSALSRVLQRQGFKGLWIGTATAIYRDIPFNIIQMIVYEWLNGKDYGGKDPTIFQHLRNGAIAGGIAAFLTTPIDLAKTKLVTDGGKGEYLALTQTLKKIYKEGGLPGLWLGWKYRTVLTMAGGMMFFGSFETLKSHIKDNKY